MEDLKVISGKRVIIVNSKGEGGDFNRALRIANSLAENGYKVKVLTWSRSGEDPKFVRISKYKVEVFHLKPFAFPPLGLALTYFIWWAYVISYLLRNDSELYHVQGLFSFIPVFLVCTIRRKAVIYDLIDFVADSFKWPKLIRKFLAWLENLFLRFAEGVIVVDINKQQLNMANVKRLAVVTNFPCDLRDKLGTLENKGGKFVIYYGGAIYRVRGIAHVCEAIKNLEGIKFVIAGYGSDEAELKASYRRQSNVEFIGLLSPIRSLEWAYKADLVPVFYDPKIPIHRFASPAKLYDAMMCGTPVLVNSEALPVADTVKKERCGLAVPYGDVNAIRDAIMKIRENYEVKMDMGQNARKAFVREYNWTVMESRLLKLYGELTPT